MKTPGRVLVMLGLLVGAAQLIASGPLGIYGIVEKVVFEPDEKTPERIQVWGAFEYVDGASPSVTVSAAKRGYLYFRLPTGADGATDRSQVEVIKSEWADLKAVAGTGQAIGFGRWGYIGAFPGLQPDTRSNRPPYILERGHRNPQTDLRVRPGVRGAGFPGALSDQRRNRETARRRESRGDCETATGRAQTIGARIPNRTSGMRRDSRCRQAHVYEGALGPHAPPIRKSCVVVSPSRRVTVADDRASCSSSAGSFHSPVSRSAGAARKYSPGGRPLTLYEPSVAGRVMRTRREPGVQCRRSDEKTQNVVVGRGAAAGILQDAGQARRLIRVRDRPVERLVRVHAQRRLECLAAVRGGRLDRPFVARARRVPRRRELVRVGCDAGEREASLRIDAAAAARRNVRRPIPAASARTTASGARRASAASPRRRPGR